MRARAALVASCVLVAVASASAQPGPSKKTAPDPVPPEAVILDLRSAYSKPIAEEVSVRFRPPAGTGSTERTDSFIVRIDPGDPGAPNRPKAVLLELGALRVYLAAGKLTAINTSVADKLYTHAYAEPLTVARLAELLPPLPIPQLAFAADADLQLRAPLPQLTDIAWEKGIWDDLAHPPMVTMKGSGASGNVELQVGVQSRRLLKLTATIRRAGSEGTFDLTCRAIDPGDSSKWVIPSEGRQAVPSLIDLKPSAKPLAALELGQPVPNITFSRFDMTGWQLHETLDAAKPGLLILFRGGPDHQKADAVLRDARAGLTVLRAMHAPDGSQPRSAAAIAIELGDFTQDRWKEARLAWSSPPDPAVASPPTAVGADDLMWSSSAAQSIDRFSTTAAAAIVVIRPDRTLAAVISLDGRSEKQDEVAAELRRALFGQP